ncbi:insecticidal delta-endotoxin Cry8Ea1 family protein [Bacillus sp. FSL L8-0152]|uniref:insecticidal delta-endotoxin Cry8Ea1 family protein n=1 Tax=Bacillus sp. FSL L8-0152 TaxID=2921516 RepID=UPI0030F742E4
MNQNNNNNKYEIIDSHTSSYLSNKNSNHSKYPYTNNPNQPLQNTNYKDWINMCQGNQQYGNNFETFASADTIAAVSASTIVSGTMLAGIGGLTAIAGPIGIIGAIIISFGTLLPIFWPQGEQDKTVWTQFIRMGEIFVDQPLSETIKQLKLQSLEGIRQVLKSYDDGLNYWISLKKQQKDPKNPSPELQQAALTVKTRFDNVHHDFIREIPGFQLETYKTLLLPIYAEVANFHLNLLQQGIEFADQWNADIFPSQIEPNAGTSDDYYKLLKENIPKYSNYCAKTYREGLNALRNEPNMKWSTFNDYRRYMTISVLDTISIFSLYDIKKYRDSIGGIQGINYELTREIYTTEINFDRITSPKVQPDLSAMEYNLTRSGLKLFSFLEELIFYTENETYGNRLVGIANRNRPTYAQQGTEIIYGKTTLSPTTKILRPFESYKVSIITDRQVRPTVPSNTIYFIINQIELYLNNSPSNRLTYSAGGNLSNDKKTTDFQFPVKKDCKQITDPNCLPNYNSYSHILSQFSLYPYSYPTGLALTILYTGALGWTHSSVNRNNAISDKIITMIPAIKGNSLDTNSKVIEGPGHTGGNLVYLQSQGRLEITCRSPNSTQSYYIRLRYATNGAGNTLPNISLTIPGVTGIPPQRLNNTFSSANYNNLQYEDFWYFQFPGTITLPLNQNIQFIFNRVDVSNSILIIDKIEFIPITSSMRQDREKQKLEIVQTKINTFFTNHIKNTLNIEATDYDIDQTAIQIQPLSEELYPQKK